MEPYCSSVTEPSTVPVSSWARTGAAVNTAIAAARTPVAVNRYIKITLPELHFLVILFPLSIAQATENARGAPRQETSPWTGARHDTADRSRPRTGAIAAARTLMRSRRSAPSTSMDETQCVGN